MVFFCSISILYVENDPASNIKTASDAIWWAFVTSATVGYGDKFPVTVEGRIIGGILMFMGIGLFGTFTALVSSWFVGVQEKPENKESANADIARLESKINDILLRLKEKE